MFSKMAPTSSRELVPAYNSISVGGGSHLTVFDRLNTAASFLSSLENQATIFKQLIMSKQDYLPSAVIHDFQSFIASEEARLAGARKELVGLCKEVGWDDTDLTSSFPVPTETPAQKVDCSTAISQPAKPIVNPLQSSRKTEIGSKSPQPPTPITELSSSPATNTIPSPFNRHEVGLPTSSASPFPLNRTDSGLAIDPEEFVCEVVELSPQENEVSNFQLSSPSRPTLYLSKNPSRVPAAKESEKQGAQKPVDNFRDQNRRRSLFAFSPRSRSRASTYSAISRQEPITSPPLPLRKCSVPLVQKPITPSLSLNVNPSPQLPVYYSENPQTTTWIMDSTWLCISTSDPTSPLHAPETLFASSRYQAGLLATDSALSTPSSSPTSLNSPASIFSSSSRDSDATITTCASPTLNVAPNLPSAALAQLHGALTTPLTISKAQKINLHLLRSCALLACQQPVRALQAADVALKHADDHGIAYMVSKSHLYRGLALMGLGRWEEAEESFGKAGGVRGWGLKMGKLRERCVVQVLEYENAMKKDCGDERDRIKIQERGEWQKETTLEREKVRDRMSLRDQDVLWGVWGGE
jgi:hypothetical protein